MNEAKIQLSADELTLVENADWILTKNTIIRKVYDLFGFLSEEMKAEVSHMSFPRELEDTTPKISRGENYRGLPYVVLDYPRFFTKEDIFAVRTLFWWGRYFSMTLHMKGRFKDHFVESIKKNISLLFENDFYLSISQDEWSHDIQERNHILLGPENAALAEEIFSKQPFVKLSVKISLKQWNKTDKLLLSLFKIILHSLNN